jgi:hypothetical protein
MKNGKRIQVMLMLTLLTTPALAANKCIDGNGRISYQAAPCPATAHGGDMSLNVNRSVTGQAKPPDAPQAAPTITLSADPPRQDTTENPSAPPTDAEQE